jgi:hypothetical protein
MITILSVLLIVLGISSVIVTIEGYDKTYIEKYNKIKLFIDLVTGFSYAIMGLLVILKVISGRYLVFLVILFTILNSLINYKIKTQVNR